MAWRSRGSEEGIASIGSPVLFTVNVLSSHCKLPPETRIEGVICNMVPGFQNGKGANTVI